MLALTLSGRTPEITLLLNPTVVEAPDEAPEETNSRSESHTEMERGIEPEHTVLIDYLTTETLSLGENNAHEDADEEVPPFRLIWEVPKVYLTCFVCGFVSDINRM